MRDVRRWWQLAAAAAFLCPYSPVNGLPQEPAMERREVAKAAPSPWITVDTSGNGHTITPVVTTTNGVTTTISAAPDSLLATGTYIMSPDGHASTTTGLAPVATATNAANDAGAFLACTIYQGEDKPFCQPKDGSLLNPGSTYYITWNPAYFFNQSTPIQVQGSYASGGGFTSPRMEASTGFFAWEVGTAFLSSMGVTSLNVTIKLAYFEDGNEPESFVETAVEGPTVIVTSTVALIADGAAGSVHVSPTVIAVPVVIGLAVLCLVGACCWSWRRTGRIPIIGALGGRSGQGYGVRQSRTQRVSSGSFGAVRSDKPGPNVGIQLTDRESWSPTTLQGARLGSAAEGQSRNVFREELARQERAG